MNKPTFLYRQTKIVKIGNSAGIVLPKEVLAKLNAQVGDEIDAVLEDGTLILRPRDDGFEEEMRLAREIMIKRRSALRELAK